MPTTFDTATFPYGVSAGANKFGMTHCPFCSAEGITPTAAEWAQESNQAVPVRPIFLFRDELSAKEYAISGLCQHCQDKMFGGSDD